MLMLSLPTVAMLAVIAVIVDRVVGEPSAAHPLVAFGRLAARIEAALNTGRRGRLTGIAAWLAAVAPPVLIAAWLAAALPTPLAAALHVALLWFALGAKSLADHLAPIAAALFRHDLPGARALT
ncbi:cobalamin biosynthesis protein, partial [Burkholderia ubonensis]